MAGRPEALRPRLSTGLPLLDDEEFASDRETSPWDSVAKVSAKNPNSSAGYPLIHLSEPGLSEPGPLRCYVIHEYAGVRVWRLDLSEVADSYLQGEIAVLSDEELARSRRFKFPEDARRFVLARAGLRRVLAGVLVERRAASSISLEDLNAAAVAVRFTTGEFGKPFLANQIDSLAFNLSHSGDVALIAVGSAAHVAVGIDVEVIRPIARWLQLARRYFTAAEISELERAQAQDAHKPPAETLVDTGVNGAAATLFIQCWTRKEAFLKTLGAGLRIPPATVEAGTDANDREVSLETPNLGGLKSNEVNSNGFYLNNQGSKSLNSTAPIKTVFIHSFHLNNDAVAALGIVNASRITAPSASHSGAGSHPARYA